MIVQVSILRSQKCAILFRFKSSLAKEIISNVLHDNLNGKKYSDHNPGELTKHLANSIRINLEGIKF